MPLYPESNPKWVEPQKVDWSPGGRYVHVTIHDIEYRFQQIRWGWDAVMNDIEFVMVQDREGNWFKVWWYENARPGLENAADQTRVGETSPTNDTGSAPINSQADLQDAARFFEEYRAGIRNSGRGDI